MAHRASRILVRLPGPLHDALKSEAAHKSVTLNELCVQALRRILAEKGERPVSMWPPVARILESSVGPRLSGIVLFGSKAREEARASSDMDLLLCLAPGERLTRDLYAEWDVLVAENSETIPSGLSPHFSRLPDTPDNAGSLWFEVSIDGVVLWDPAQTISRFLASVRRHLLSGGAVRKTSYGVPYWVRSHAERAAR